MTFRTKRIYEPPSMDDGLRVLVDRVWPQGISRYDARIDLWNKDVAPTGDLRKWFGHKPERWKEFQRRYRAEMAHNAAIGELRKLGRAQVVTLLYAARDMEHNHTQLLVANLRRKHKSPVQDLQAETIETTSPACFAHDADPAYMGYLPAHELVCALNTLLEAERTGARMALRFAQQTRDDSAKNLMETVRQSHIKWCALLRRAVHALGGEPSRKSGGPYDKTQVAAGARGRLTVLVRGLEWTVQRLQETLPKIADDGVHRDLTAMLKAHKTNSRLLAGAMAAQEPRESGARARRQPSH